MPWFPCCVGCKGFQSQNFIHQGCFEQRSGGVRRKICCWKSCSGKEQSSWYTPDFCFTAENHPWMHRKIIWTKSSLFCSMLIVRGVVSWTQNSDSDSGWFLIFHPNMKAHPVKDRRQSSPNAGQKTPLGFFWLDMTLTMRSMACHLHPQDKEGKIPSNVDEKSSQNHHHPEYSWESNGYQPPNVPRVNPQEIWP